MRRRTKQIVPRCFGDHPECVNLLAEFDVTPARTRLKAKVLVFKDNKSLRRFWKKCLDCDDICRKTCGAVHDLGWQVIQFEKGKPDRHFYETDSRYFCVIGLLAGHLTMEVLTHECGHAAFALVTRARCKTWARNEELEEEQVCYPLGQIASAINHHLHAKGLYAHE